MHRTPGRPGLKVPVLYTFLLHLCNGLRQLGKSLGQQLETPSDFSQDIKRVLMGNSRY